MFIFSMDPPWNTDDGGGDKGAQNHYPTMSVDKIADTIRMARPWVDTGDALGAIWSTSLAVLEGDFHALCNRLHVRPCSGFVWNKVDVVAGVVIACPRCLQADDDHHNVVPAARKGLGFWSRCEHEHLFIVRRGDVDVPPAAARMRSVIYAPRGVHSAKPEDAWQVIEQTFSAATGADGGGVEFFSRERRFGWGAWGHLHGVEAGAVYVPRPPDEAWRNPFVPVSS